MAALEPFKINDGPLHFGERECRQFSITLCIREVSAIVLKVEIIAISAHSLPENHTVLSWGKQIQLRDNHVPGDFPFGNEAPSLHISLDNPAEIGGKWSGNVPSLSN
jgi:hypothetical protein